MALSSAADFGAADFGAAKFGAANFGLIDETLRHRQHCDLDHRAAAVPSVSHCEAQMAAK
jgi:hypothetical protein